MQGKVVLITGASSGVGLASARRLAGTRLTANCLSPGPTRTRFGDEMKGLPALFPLLVKRIPFLCVDPEKGAQTPVFVASSPDLDMVSGSYFVRRRARRTRPITYDTQVAAELWNTSKRLTASRFPMAAGPLTTQPIFAPSGGALKGMES